MRDSSIVRPRAQAIVHSLRSLGYDLHTAIADIVDNSLAAGARSVGVRLAFDGPDSWVRIEDDGRGMGAEALENAMRLGSHDPRVARAAGDHGRFGLGLKTASFSQCLRLTVRSRAASEAEVTRCWDLAHVTEHDEWALLREPYDVRSDSRLGHVEDGRTGTIVLWELLDRLVVDPALPIAHAEFDARVRETDGHLATVFHRFLAEKRGLVLTLNDVRIEPRDPFLARHPETLELPISEYRVRGSRVEVAPFVLPDVSRLKPEEAEATAGPRGWFGQQGFYLYRNRRLLVAGHWLGAGRRTEAHKLARIRVDFDNTLDDLWQIDVRKARARIPDALKGGLHIDAYRTCQHAEKVVHGRTTPNLKRGKKNQVYLWEIREQGGRNDLRVNAAHPLVASVREALGERAKELDALLSLLSASVPVPVLMQLSGATLPTETATVTAPASDMEIALQSVVVALRRKGMSDAAIRERLIAVEPWSLNPELIERLNLEKV